MENRSLVLSVLMLALTASYSSKNAEDEVDRSAASARSQYELSKDELARMKARYRSGDAEAAYKISQHYSSLGTDFLHEYIEWLERSFKLKNKQAGVEFLSTLVLTKQCDRFLKNKSLYLNYFSSNDINLEEIEDNYDNICRNR
ncbi:MAG: hypothetical protein ACRCY3_14900 [Sphingorhabdus sp.]